MFIGRRRFGRGRRQRLSNPPHDLHDVRKIEPGQDAHGLACMQRDVVGPRTGFGGESCSLRQ
jgi:hypothetical protein